MDNRNLFVAIALSMGVLLLFQWLSPAPKRQQPPPQTVEEVKHDLGMATAASPPKTRSEALADSTRVTIDTPLIRGSIALKGARFDDITLLHYHYEVDPASPPIVLLSPVGAKDPAYLRYFAEFGWTADGAAMPDADSEWHADGTSLSVGHPVTLTWDNGQGQHFTRTVAIDDHYMFTITDKVENAGPAPVTVRPFALLSRTGVPPNTNNWLSYEGPMGAFDGVEEDVKYASISEAQPVERQSTGGWVGFSDKYWLGAIAPANQSQPMAFSFHHAGTGDSQRYQLDYLGHDQVLAPGAAASNDALLFAGAKEVKLLTQYRNNLGLARFDNAIDFGWFWFFTKPIFYLLDLIYEAVGNFGVAIVCLTVIMRALFFPLQTRAVLSMNKMKALQPEMQRLKEQFADDKARQNQELANLYKNSAVNPLAGCLPVLLQIPVFWSLYKVLFVTIEMRHAPFFGWIHDLSAPDPTNIFTLFGLIPGTPPAFLPHVGVWQLIYCAAMMTQQRLGPQMPDQTQARLMLFMPVIFALWLGNVPVGLVIYWSWSSTLMILQQYIITRHVVAKVPQRA